ncbi:MAG TPA: DUF2934 domain-containing protein [Gemmataceae bacterium]|nr:DUF2934 domain-containing protein [Gemmataceae bacterium]
MSRIASSPQTRTPVASPAKTPPVAAAGGGSVPQEKIAKRAYEKWLKRGCGHGSDMQDWIEAEAELRAEAGMPGKQGMSSHR